MLRTHLLLGWMNLALTAPVIYLLVGLPLVLRQQGMGGTHIGLLQLAALPALIKFLLAAPIERRAPGTLPQRHYRHWAIWLSLGYAAALLLLAAHPLDATPYATLFCLTLLANLLATWCDVPVNALAIALLPEAERIRAGAIKSAAMSLASIIGGGLMLLLHTRQGWAAPLLTLAAGMLLCALLLPGLKTPPCSPTPPDATPKDGLKNLPPEVGAAVLNGRPGTNHSRSGATARICNAAGRQNPQMPAAQEVFQTIPKAPSIHPRLWASWFATPQNRLWALLLLLYYPPMGAAWIYLKPLLLDAGLAPETIALLVGVVGGLLAAAASMAASQLSKRMGPRRALPLFALGDVLALAALFSAVVLRLGTNALLAAALLLALMVGASAGLVFGLMMQHTRTQLCALDYGTQSSLFVLGRTCIPLLAGLALERSGYGPMLGGLLLLLVLVWALVWMPAAWRSNVHPRQNRGSTPNGTAQ